MRFALSGRSLVDDILPIGNLGSQNITFHETSGTRKPVPIYPHSSDFVVILEAPLENRCHLQENFPDSDVGQSRAEAAALPPQLSSEHVGSAIASLHIHHCRNHSPNLDRLHMLR